MKIIAMKVVRKESYSQATRHEPKKLIAVEFICYTPVGPVSTKTVSEAATLAQQFGFANISLSS